MSRCSPTTFRGRWVRVTRRNPCAICGKPDWCTVTQDGLLACCARVASDRRLGEAGWAHDLGLGARPLPPAPPVDPPPDPAELKLEDLEQLHAEFRAAATASGLLATLAAELGVQVWALEALGAGWSSRHRAWTFPMTDHRRRLRGFRLRLQSGRKISVRGGHEGIFLPQLTPETDGWEDPLRGLRLVVVEGPTDCAAAIGLRLLAVGRPSCSGGARLIVRLVRERRPSQVAIVADADGPGREGARHLAADLSPWCSDVRVVEPPAPHKDLRAWTQAGATREQVWQLLNSAPSWRTRIARSA